MTGTTHYGLTQYENDREKMRIVQAEHSLNRDMQIIDRVLHAHAGSLAKEFEPREHIRRDDFRMHEDVLYRYSGADAPGDNYVVSGWNQAEWTPATIEEMLALAIEREQADKLDLQLHPDKVAPYGYIGRRVEGGGTIFFDYRLGFQGDVTVEPRIEPDDEDYHVDPATGLVVYDRPDSSTPGRFLVVSDDDIGETANSLLWAEEGNSNALASCYGAVGFGEGENNTEKCIEAARSDDLLGGGANGYRAIWKYINEMKGPVTKGKWFLPSRDELNVLMNVQSKNYSKRKGYNPDTQAWDVQIPRLPVCFYARYYYSSSKPLLLFGGVSIAEFSNESMKTLQGSPYPNIKVRLVRWY